MGQRRRRAGAWVLALPGLALLVAGPLPGCRAPDARALQGPVTRAIEASRAGGTQRFTGPEWTALLAASVKGNLLDYSYLQNHRAELDAYLGRIASAHLDVLAPSHLEALLINAYNACTVASVLDHPGVSSIREIPGVWTTVTHRVGGFDITLDALEHGLLRPLFRDPRIHFAVNCASRSCAPLPPWAYEGDPLEQQLEERARAFLRDPRNVRVEGGTLLLSSYFKWYGADFTAPGWHGAASSIPAYVARHSSPEVAGALARIPAPPAFLDYDWSLNSSISPDSGPGHLDPGGPQWLVELRGRILSYGPAGMLLYGLLYISCTLALVPGSILSLGAGAAYGAATGFVLISFSSTTGAALAFLLSRHLVRERVGRWIAGHPRLDAVDRKVARHGWKIVALMRLSPALPFNLLNYALGLTAIGFWPYVLTSWIAMMPGTLVFVWIGSLGVRVVASPSAALGTAGRGLEIAGLAATVAVIVMITSLARRAMLEVDAEG